MAMVHFSLILVVTSFLLISDCTGLSFGEQGCTDNTNCTYGNGVCNTNTCGCAETDYYDDNADQCQTKRGVGGACTTAGTTTECSDINSVCTTETGGNKCRCKENFYDSDLDNSNVAGVCTAKIALGDSCTDTVQCSVDNSECVTFNRDKCTCMAGYYRDDQTCKQLSALQVSDLKVPDDTTGETYFLVTWKNSTTISYIYMYQLIIAFDGQSEPPVNISNTATHLNVTSRTPGRTYSITLRSVETRSRPTPQNTDVTISDGTRPAIPGNITQTTFDAPDIHISWTITGDIQYLSGNINDTTAFPHIFNQTAVNRQSPNVFIYSLRHGERYHFSVTSHSNGFSSAPKTQTIRTTPTKPNPPVLQQVDESNRFSTSIKIIWTAPALPNGDIMYYLIDTVDKAGSSAPPQVNTSTHVTEWTIKSLLEEHNYCFTVKTVNDGNENIRTSNSSNEICSSTKAGVSTMPLSVMFHSVQNRSIQLSWSLPQNPKGALYGYRLQLRANDTCQVEVVFICTTGCNTPTIPFSYCGMNKPQILVNKSSIEMNTTITYTVEHLLPYTEYNIWIAAVNAIGDGERNETMIKTDSEVPQKPQQVNGTEDDDPKTLQVSWKQPLPRPGITNYIVKVYEEDDDGNNFILKKEKNVSGYFTQATSVTGLEEYWQYKFMIVATTIKGSISSDMSDAVRTKYAAPGDIENLDVNHPANVYTKMDITWNAPSIRNRNSIIMEYKIMHNITGTKDTLVVLANETRKKTLNVTPEETYLIEVYAVNTMGQNGSLVEKLYVAKPGPPVYPDFPAVVDDKTTPTVTTQNTIKVKLVLNWFLDETNGKRTDGGVIVCPAASCGNYGSDQSKVSTHFSTLDTWKASKNTGFAKPYRVTNRTWVDDNKESQSRRKRSNTVIELTIGEDNDCDKLDPTVYCNGPLPAGTSFKVVAFVCSSGGCTESVQYGPYTTQAVPVSNNIAIIAGVVAAVVVFIIVIIVVVVVLKRRGSNNEHKPMEKELTDYDNPAGLQTPSVERKNIKNKRPIRLSEFAAKVQELHKDSNLKFAHEYEELKTLTDPKTLKGAVTDLAETEENKLKNRYVNILPYDKTIVKLLPLEDDDENASTFINANYIPGYTSQREYIACQGPIPSTIDDFWRMVWEQSVSIIVMLTLCKEDGRIKCECYWPTETSEAKQFGDIIVELTSCSTINTYEIRIFKLTLGNKSRNIKHFHFLNWKDFSANVQNDVMIDFIQNVRSHVTIPESRVPMIVHCSAGVGRTGTYIALDHLMQFIRDHDFNASIDIFDMVVKMRECRMFMVQTEQQYIFIHDCIKDILDRKRQKELESENEGLYGNDSLYGNSGVQDNIYDNQAFEGDLYQNVSLGQPKTDL